MATSQAIGLIETRGMVPLIEAADTALKAANVKLSGWQRVGSEYVTVVLTGEVADVKAAVEAGAAVALKKGKLVGSNVIAQPHGDLAMVLPKIKFIAKEQE
jgi:ethanolamine utilization protein EutM